MASRAFAFRSFSRAMCSSGVNSRSNPGLAHGTSRGSSNGVALQPHREHQAIGDVAQIRRFEIAENRLVEVDGEVEIEPVPQQRPRVVARRVDQAGRISIVLQAFQVVGETIRTPGRPPTIPAHRRVPGRQPEGVAPQPRDLQCGQRLDELSGRRHAQRDDVGCPLRPSLHLGESMPRLLEWRIDLEDPLDRWLCHSSHSKRALRESARRRRNRDRPPL